jgi:hypothetical protein
MGRCLVGGTRIRRRTFAGLAGGRGDGGAKTTPAGMVIVFDTPDGGEVSTTMAILQKLDGKQNSWTTVLAAVLCRSSGTV